MKMKTAIKMVMGMFLACFTLNALATDTVISDVVVRQRWPWSRLVDIDYVLTGDAEERVDVHLAAKDGPKTLNLPLDSLTGNLYNVEPGPRRIVWDPIKTAYTNSQMLTKFNVTLTPITKPLYMIVDLTKDAGAPGQIEYVTEAALHSGAYSTVETNPVAGVNSIVWTGVTNNLDYATDKLVLRRVPAGSYQMGDTQSGDNNVTLTKDMYVGVFLVTLQQWNRIMTGTGGADTRAMHAVSYYRIRENYAANANDPAVDWPANTAVNPSSFVGKLRTQTGICDFDLPTDAQWEYACRARTATFHNDGIENNSTNQLNVLGWWKGNCSKIHPVGEKTPNAWGLYDMHGSVWEWCLDWHADSLTGGNDPNGVEEGIKRVIRGGSWRDDAWNCRSAARVGREPWQQHDFIGFRLVRTLP